jgi:formylglycine-generating enzyme required for sulfatase activity
MNFRGQQTVGNSPSLGHLWAVLLPFYLFTAAALDPQEVTNREYHQFVQATKHPPPEDWVNGHYAADMENEPVVLVSWHEAVSYCRWVGRRLPTVDEWTSTCEAGKLKKRGNIWEWTSTDVNMGGQVYKALCGPSNTCDCSHRYLPEWKNGVKGFRCSRDSGPLTGLPLFLRTENYS